MNEITFESVKDFIYNTLIADKPLEEQMKLYQSVADQYQEICDASVYNYPEIVATEFLYFNLPRDSRILDVGAGTGLLERLLYKSGFTNIDALDGCEEMLQKAKESNSNYKNYIIARVVKDEPLPVEQNTYDVALMSGSASPAHIDVDAYPQIIRVVKPGGIIGWIIETEEIFAKVNSKYQNGAYKKSLQRFVLQNLLTPIEGFNPKPVENSLFYNVPAEVYFFKVV
ncbi:malonyl-[acyl-carrier protein] O-methyltransferase-like protein [Dinothrombium tinctorium]|uniref:Malonyl-[acyl-carrier protein] O-methyltransferase-like protein n=1 Tax=Dinothrombium tinctorium TaxID=1965070 RepID=A0A443QCN9_9ACAR|nr:malonyl-[acyl-carrier protein] O-methyltransferase-like protein [Dinothrombium tinctorium]